MPKDFIKFMIKVVIMKFFVHILMNREGFVMGKKETLVGKIGCILLGLLMAYVITLIGILLLAFGLYKWNFSVNTVEIGILVLYLVSCLIGGMIAGKKAGSRKFFWGLMLGMSYFLVLVILSLIGEQGIVSGFKEIVLPGIICLFSGMLGGMLV